MKTVAVLIESSTQYGRDLLRGVVRYAHLFGWRLRYEQGGLNRMEPAWLRAWDGDGVITRASRLCHSPGLRKRGIAVVGCANDPAKPTPEDVPDSDNPLIGSLAARYFIDKGFRSFAFIGFRDAAYSLEREKGFAEALRVAKMPEPAVLRTRRSGSGRGYAEGGDRDFLRALRLPCAVFCATDERAAQVLGLARDEGLVVPEQLSVLGVDNDPLLCQLSATPLSSIDTDAQKIGLALAQQLDLLMRGREARPAPRIPPLRVVERLSTAREAVADPHLIKALAFIRTNAGRLVSVGDVARAAGLSRRSLEYRFRDHFQTSVGVFLRKRLVESIKELLIHTDSPLEQLAETVGIEHMQHFHDLFRRIVGCSPAGFRRENRRPAGDAEN